jgi:hypothetical protein
MSQFGEPSTPLDGRWWFDDDGDPYRLWDAAYVLGSLSSSERYGYEQHLGTCAPCKLAVSDLGGMPAMLASLDAADAAAIDGSGHLPGAESPLPPALLTSVIAKATRRQRRTRVINWTSTAAVAAALVIGAYFAFPSHLAAHPTSLAPAVRSAMTMMRVAPNAMTAIISLSGHEWGTGIEMTCTYGERPGNATSESLAMVVVSRDGRSAQLASWVGLVGVSASPRGSTSTPIDQIAAVQVVSTETGNVLLQRNL